MLIPNQYTLAEANQLVPLLESTLQEIGAALVEMHRAKLSIRIRARAQQAQHADPHLSDDRSEVTFHAADGSFAAEHRSEMPLPDDLAGAARDGELGQRPRRHDWPVGIALEHVVSPPEELAHAMLEAVEQESAAARGMPAPGIQSALQALFRSSEVMDATEEDAQALDAAESKIRHELDVLQRMGVFVHSMEPPTVHLLSRRGASPVLLSWRPGEPEFMHWHSLDWGLEERAPIDDPKLFGDCVLPC